METTSLVAVTGGLAAGGSSTFLINLAIGLRSLGERGAVLSLSTANAYVNEFQTAEVEVSTIDDTLNIYEDSLAIAYSALACWQPRAVLACLGGNSFDMLRMVPNGVVRLGIIQSDHMDVYEVVRRFVPWLDCVVGVSSAICSRVRTMPEVKHVRVERIPYGICFPPAEERLPTDCKGPLRLVYAGRLIEEQKRVSRLIALASALVERKVNFRLTIAGGGPERATLERALGGDANTVFLGELAPHAVQELFRHQDVFVLLSDYEGLPLSLIEAMGAGVVPVVSDLESGVRDVVSADCGYRVPVGDIDAAADAIQQLWRDRGRLRAMSDTARSVRGEYSASRMAERYLALIADLGGKTVVWPKRARYLPPPGGALRWIHWPVARPARRWIKRFIASRRGQSSLS